MIKIIDISLLGTQLKKSFFSQSLLFFSKNSSQLINLQVIIINP